MIDATLMDRVASALLDASCPQSTERRVSDTFSVVTAGFVVTIESPSTVKVVYHSNRLDDDAMVAALNTYKDTLNYAGFRTHLNDGRILVMDKPAKAEPTTLEPVVVADYTDDDVRDQRNILLVEMANTFTNGMKRAYANQLVEAWINHTMPATAHSFCLTAEMGTRVYDKMYAIECMTACQVARIYKYSRPNIDWSQTEPRRG